MTCVVSVQTTTTSTTTTKIKPTQSWILSRIYWGAHKRTGIHISLYMHAKVHVLKVDSIVSTYFALVLAYIRPPGSQRQSSKANIVLLLNQAIESKLQDCFLCK